MVRICAGLSAASTLIPVGWGYKGPPPAILAKPYSSQFIITLLLHRLRHARIYWKGFLKGRVLGSHLRPTENIFANSVGGWSPRKRRVWEQGKRGLSRDSQITGCENYSKPYPHWGDVRGKGLPKPRRRVLIKVSYWSSIGQ